MLYSLVLIYIQIVSSSVVICCHVAVVEVQLHCGHWL